MLLQINHDYNQILEGVVVEINGIWRYQIAQNKTDVISDNLLKYVNFITDAWATCLNVNIISHVKLTYIN
jgi:hypothetical protein